MLDVAGIPQQTGLCPATVHYSGSGRAQQCTHAQSAVCGRRQPRQRRHSPHSPRVQRGRQKHLLWRLRPQDTPACGRVGWYRRYLFYLHLFSTFGDLFHYFTMPPPPIANKPGIANSAPYLRLKNSERTSKSKYSLLQHPEKFF